MRQKLRNDRGESIAESLVSILVVALASILFAGMVTASSRVIERSSKWMADYYAAVSSINNQIDNEYVDVDDTVNVKIVNVAVSVSGNETNEAVTAFINDDLGVPIVNYIKGNYVK